MKVDVKNTHQNFHVTMLKRRQLTRSITGLTLQMVTKERTNTLVQLSDYKIAETWQLDIQIQSEIDGQSVHTFAP